MNKGRQKRPRPDDYAAYLRSPEWRWIRNKVWKRDKGRCVICGAPGTEVHHRHYHRTGRERMKDLLTLCRSCHTRVHAAGIRLPAIRGRGKRADRSRVRVREAANG